LDTIKYVLKKKEETHKKIETLKGFTGAIIGIYGNWLIMLFEVISFDLFSMFLYFISITSLVGYFVFVMLKPNANPLYRRMLSAMHPFFYCKLIFENLPSFKNYALFGSGMLLFLIIMYSEIEIWRLSKEINHLSLFIKENMDSIDY